MEHITNSYWLQPPWSCLTNLRFHTVAGTWDWCCTWVAANTCRGAVHLQDLCQIFFRAIATWSTVAAANADLSTACAKPTCKCRRWSFSPLSPSVKICCSGGQGQRAVTLRWIFCLWYRIGMFVVEEHTWRSCCCSQVLPQGQQPVVGLGQHLPSQVRVLLAIYTIRPESPCTFPSTGGTSWKLKGGNFPNRRPNCCLWTRYK